MHYRACLSVCHQIRLGYPVCRQHLPGRVASDVRSLSENLFHDSRQFNARQPFFQATAGEEEFLVMQTQEVQDRGVEVVNTNRILHSVVAEVVRHSVSRATFYSTSGHP